MSNGNALTKTRAPGARPPIQTDTTSLVPLDQTQAAGLVMAVAGPDQMRDALRQYRAIQTELDKSMPECILDIKGKKFRTKPYWRAVATIFGISVSEPSHEVMQPIPSPYEDDWAVVVSVTASAPNGRTGTGSGSCSASEKWSIRNGTIISRSQASLHNVLAHAETRAINRAVSDLVGFGEVSAEEVRWSGGEPSEDRQTPHQQFMPPQPPQPPQRNREPQRAPQARAQPDQFGMDMSSDAFAPPARPAQAPTAPVQVIGGEPGGVEQGFSGDSIPNEASEDLSPGRIRRLYAIANPEFGGPGTAQMEEIVIARGYFLTDQNGQRRPNLKSIPWREYDSVCREVNPNPPQAPSKQR